MSALIKAYHCITQLTGKKRYVAAFAGGVCMTLAMPPLFALPMMLPAVISLYWLMGVAPTRKTAAWLGWWFGLGFFTTSTYWIAISMLVDAARFAWMIPFCIFGLSGYLALFFALLGYVWRASNVQGVRGALLFAALWSLCEYLRGTLLTGFPWNVTGLVWSAWPWAIQSAIIWGAFGLGFLTILLCANCALLPTYGTPAKKASLTVALLWCVLIGWGGWRVSTGQHETVENVKLRIVQASIPQDLKWNPQAQLEGLRKHIRLTRGAGYEAITHVIWPETAVPFALNETSEILPAVAQHAPAGGALLTGALYATGEKENWQIWNSLFVISAKQIESHYDKVKLVPFGEFVPLRKLFPGINKITPGSSDFSKGVGAVTTNVPGAPAFQGLVCYEAIFADFISHEPRPEWLVNITNDAWFGVSSGPYQHLHLVQMRAVERGLPLIRAANTGVSAVINGYGQITQTLPLNESGIIDAGLPKALPDTFFAKHGTSPWLLLLGILALIIQMNKK